MKQILLSVPAVRSKVFLGELMQPFQIHAATAAKIELPERFHHPDIDREGGRKSIRKQQHTIRDLSADPTQIHQLGASDLERQTSEFLQIKLAAGNGPCR